MRMLASSLFVLALAGGISSPSAPILGADNTLTPGEKRDGWRLLFDGNSTKGWRNFKSTTISNGWRVKDGELQCWDPHGAGDIVTDEKFDWFELSIDYKIAKGSNSGIMFRVADDGEATWHSGPEVQILDNVAFKRGQLAGHLYELYNTDIDATKPAEEWNHLDIRIAPDYCETKMNGVSYYKFVLGSDDFKARVAKSKFSQFAKFGTLPRGSIAIQGDHGVVAFRNIKIRPLKGGR